MSRKHPNSYERQLPNRRRELIEFAESVSYAKTSSEQGSRDLGPQPSGCGPFLM